MFNNFYLKINTISYYKFVYFLRTALYHLSVIDKKEIILFDAMSATTGTFQVQLVYSRWHELEFLQNRYE